MMYAITVLDAWQSGIDIYLKEYGCSVTDTLFYGEVKLKSYEFGEDLLILLKLKYKDVDDIVYEV